MEAAIRSKPISTNIILDISQGLRSDGESLLKLVKRQCVDVIRTLSEDNYDTLHLYNPDDDFKYCILNGEKVGLINNYDHPQSKYNIRVALERSSFFFFESFSQNKNVILFFTDRLQNDDFIKRFVSEVRLSGHDLEFIYLSLRSACIQSIEHEGVRNIHLDQVDDFKIQLIEDIFQ